VTDYSKQIGFSIKRLHRLMDQRVNDLLRPYDLARSQWYTLYFVQRADTTTQKELLEWLAVEPATLSGIVDSLVRKGILARSPSKADKRTKELRLTRKGQKLWEQLPDPIIEINKQMLAGLDAVKVQHVRAFMDQAIKNLEQ
jgi:MarR family transcriptional regulator, lower aerobic nicotinate degradation pathway regulator